jgi:hypothetical protein
MSVTASISSIVGKSAERSALFAKYKASEKPEASAEFIEREYIGTVAEVDYARMKSVVEGIELPGKQFDGSRRIDPEEVLRRCQEWTGRRCGS